MKQRLTMNVLLSLLIDAKITGKGTKGNGRLLVDLLLTAADTDGKSANPRYNIYARFTDASQYDATKLIDKKIYNFIPQGKYYPYENITFTALEDAFETGQMKSYLTAADKFIEETIAPEKLDSLVYTLLCLISEDDTISTLYYGNRVISKSELEGTPAHPVTVCPAALLIGLLYHVHKYPAGASPVKLMELPEQLPFRIENYSVYNSLDTFKRLSLRENLRESSAFQSSCSLEYEPELTENGSPIRELPEGNIYICGAGGSGKSTLLQSLAGEKCFLLPLTECPGDAGEERILAGMLLKFHYRHEYGSLEQCRAVEGKEEFCSRITELRQLLNAETVSGEPEFTLMLDGFNELPQEDKRALSEEIGELCTYRNVRIILTGRNLLPLSLNPLFRTVMLHGITVESLDKALEGFNDTIRDDRLNELLRLPLFLKMYTAVQDDLFTPGELTDRYVSELARDDVSRFLLWYAMPCVGWIMTKCITQYEITRAEVQDAFDLALKLYIHNSRIYQNNIAPNGINKKVLLLSRTNDDIVELMTDSGLLEISETDRKNVHFIHQHYREYFAAKHIVNIIRMIKETNNCLSDDEVFDIAWKAGLTGGWFDADESPEVYRLIGEISGDWRRLHFELERPTVIEDFISLQRRYNFTRGFENVAEVLGIIGNGVVCGYDFSGLSIPIMPNCQFHECSFRNSSIAYIPMLDLDSDYPYAVSGDTMVILIPDTSIVIVWSISEGKPLAYHRFDGYLCLDYPFQVQHIETDGETGTLYTSWEAVQFDLLTGEISRSGKEFTEEELAALGERARKGSGLPELDKKLLENIVTHLDLFTGCDFTGCSFSFEEYEELLGRMGAIID